MAQSRQNLADRRIATDTDGGSRDAAKRRAAALRKQLEAEKRHLRQEEERARLEQKQELQKQVAQAREAEMKMRQQRELEAKRKAEAQAKAEKAAQIKRAVQQKTAAQEKPQTPPSGRTAAQNPKAAAVPASAAGVSARSGNTMPKAVPSRGTSARKLNSHPAAGNVSAAGKAANPARTSDMIPRKSVSSNKPLPPFQSVSGGSAARRKKRNPRRSYPPNSPAAIKRKKRIQRRMGALAAAILVVALAILFSSNVIFKVVNIRLETMERTTPAKTGIYTENQIIQAAEIEEGAALFSINTKKVRENLLVSLPYLEDVQVRFSLPTTVEIQVAPAEESLYVRTGGGYAVLSKTFRVLKIDSAKPEHLIELKAKIDGTPQVGYSLAFAEVDGDKDADAKEQAREENQSLADTLETIAGYLREEGVYNTVTQINLRDMADVSLVIRDRVTIQLGTINNMDYKCRMVGSLIRNEDGGGISENDRGTLDVSRCASTSKAYFTPE